MAELLKMATWAHQRVTLWHFRTSAGKEVDFILEAPGGRLVGIEVKASATLRTDDFRPLQEWAALMKKQFVCGILLYTGDTIIPLGDRLWALPISVLWHAPSC
jgi:predicted AAA+ superfamily ATPase